MKLRDSPEVPGMPGWYAYYIRGSILSKTDPKAGAAAWRIKGGASDGGSLRFTGHDSCGLRRESPEGISPRIGSGEDDERRIGVMGRNL